MRMLFNHGLSAKDFYTNMPKRVTDKHWRWLIKHCGANKSSYEDALADPFKYAFFLILNRVLDEKKRFKPPIPSNSYIDFETVSGDKFIQQRQDGRFQEIDFIESDFKGYVMYYHLKTKTYKRDINIYVGGDLKKKFINKINSGEKFYTIKDLTINDFMDEICEKFPALSKAELKRMVTYGFRRMHSALLWGCYVSIHTLRFGNCFAHIGKLYINPLKQIDEYSWRKDRKHRMIYSWKRQDYSGYYYIGLHAKQMKVFVEDNKTSRNTLRFKNCLAKLLMEEYNYRGNDIHIFRIPVPKFKGYAHYVEDKKIKDVVYMGHVSKLKFTPSNELWKDIIKNYETRSN